MAVLFLDFDGVLHPDAAYRRGQRVWLATKQLPPEFSTAELFQWAPILQAILEPHPDVHIVISSTWVRELGYDRARAALPPGLAQRVIGATFHRAMKREWNAMSRYQQIMSWRPRNGRSVGHGWLAIDDLGGGDQGPWPEHHRAQLILTDSISGLGDAGAQSRLRAALHLIAGGDAP